MLICTESSLPLCAFVQSISLFTIFGYSLPIHSPSFPTLQICWRLGQRKHFCVVDDRKLSASFLETSETVPAHSESETGMRMREFCLEREALSSGFVTHFLCRHPCHGYRTCVLHRTYHSSHPCIWHGACVQCSLGCVFH